MTDNNLEIYYQKGGTYVIPIEVINQLTSELDDIKQENQQLKIQISAREEIIKKAIYFINNYMYENYCYVGSEDRLKEILEGKSE